MIGPGFGFGAAGRSRRHGVVDGHSPTPTPTPTPAPSWSSLPAVSGGSNPPRVGETLTATAGTIMDGTHSGWQWRRDEALIPGAAGGTYVLTTDDLGSLVGPRELAMGPGGGGSEDGDPVGPVAPAATGYTAGFTLAQFPAHEEKRIFQRTTTSGGGEGKGQGTIRVPLSGTVTAGTVGARIRSAEGGVTILQVPWDAASIDDSAPHVDITGVDARLGWFFVDLQGADGEWQLGTVKVGMGALIGVAGQSLMVRMLGRQDNQTDTYASLGVTPDANSAVLARYQEYRPYLPDVETMPWQTPGDLGDSNGPNAVGVGEYLNRMVALTGVNCGVIGYAHTGAASASFHAGQSNWAQLAACLARAGNAFEGFVWGQGHTDAASGIPPKVYGQALDAIFGQITALNSFAGYGKYVWTIPSMGLGRTWGTPWQVSRLRQGAQDWCAANGATYVHMDDTALISDGIHQNQAGSLTMGRHIYRAMRGQYGASGGLGPRPLAATRSGTTITLTLSDEGQTGVSLIGAPGNRIFVFPCEKVNPMGTNGGDNRFPVDHVSIANAMTLEIELANDPGDGHELDLWVYWPSGPANSATDNIYDDRVDEDGLAAGRIMQASLTPIRVAAPVPAGVVNAPPSGFIAPASPFSMAETGTSYGESDGGESFGQQMIGGRANAPRTPLFLPITVEGFLTCPPLPTDLVVMFGGFGLSGSRFVGLESSGRLRAWVNSVKSSTVLVPGKRYHIACQCGPSGLALYVTNITDGLPGTREYHGPSSEMVIPGSSGFTLRNFQGGYAMSGGAVDEWAVFNAERYSGASYACPTAPFTGEEADIVALYRCDGNAHDGAAK